MSIDRRKMPLRASVQANLSRQAVRSDLPIRPLERVEPVKDGGIRVFALFVLGCAIVAVVLFVFQLWLSPWLADEIGTLEYGKVRTSQYDVTLPDGYQAHFLAINLKSKAVIVEMLGYAGKIITYEGMSVASDRMVLTLSWKQQGGQFIMVLYVDGSQGAVFVYQGSGVFKLIPP